MQMIHKTKGIQRGAHDEEHAIKKLLRHEWVYFCVGPKIMYKLNMLH